MCWEMQETVVNQLKERVFSVEGGGGGLLCDESWGGSSVNLNQTSRPWLEVLFDIKRNDLETEKQRFLVFLRVQPGPRCSKAD